MYPPVEPRMTAIPPLPSAKNGRPINPIRTYRPMLIRPRRNPSDPPTSSTPNVCPVIGTGEPGIGIETFAVRKINSAPTTISAT